MGTQESQKDRNALPRISELEWEILKPLWEKGPMAARDVFREAPKHQDWSYRTVKTMLARLVKKGAITYDQIGNSYLYRAALSREEVVRAATGSFVQRVFGGALTPFMASFAEHVSDEELKRMRVELDRITKKRTRSGKRETPDD